MAAVDIATAHTFDFVRRWTPPCAAILEIGGGRGDLAAALSRDGYAVTMIDAAPEAVAAAQAKGIAAHQAVWPQFPSLSVDAVLFTRSLHHIEGLSAALEAARARLNAGGVILVEDFDFPSANEATIRWFVAQARRTAASNTLTAHSFAAMILAARDPFAAWAHDHDHEHHSIGAIDEALGAVARIVSREDAAYLYRHLISAGADESPVKAAFGEELSAIERGLIVGVGRRIVAKAHP